jgi:hypothetical protein
MPARVGQWPPEKALVQLGAAAVWIAGDCIHVVGVEISRGDHVHCEYLLGQARRVCGDSVHRPPGLGLSQLAGPAGRGVELPERVAVWIERHFLQLQPQRAGSGRHPGRIQYELLPHNDSRAPRQ